MSKLDAACRIFLGLVFFVFGLNGFFFFIPMPPPEQIPEPMRNFMGALLSTGYLFPFVKGTEVVAGALLLVNRFAGVALMALAPIVLNILGIHIFMNPDPSGLALAIALTVASVYLGIRNWNLFRGLFKGLR